MREDYLDKDSFFDYICMHFSLSGEARFLAHNILDYIAVQGCSYEEQQELLSVLLDGIGLTKEEFKKVHL